MDGLSLLEEARAGGLDVRPEGGRLVIRGPRRSEALALRLLEAKEIVLAVLAGNPDPPPFTWEELSAWRWGPAVGDPTPGIVVDEREGIAR